MRMFSTKMCLLAAPMLLAFGGMLSGNELQPIDQRFAASEGSEVPDLQRHVMPLMGKLGCNGRACHGSFQGRGGFRLSLFGYDFKQDHAALLEDGTERVDLDDPANSLILIKPTDASQHEGGKRYEEGSWSYHVLRRWIESGARAKDEPEQLVELEVTPSEILFANEGQQVQLRAVAVWNDGTREDVTPLCRFKTNSDQVAEIDQEGLVTARQPGDSHVVVFYDNGVVPVPVIRPTTDKVGMKYPHVPTPTKIDKLVVQKLKKLGIVPSELSADAEFLRRVSLDLTGTLPTARDVREFIEDKDPDKRAKKIDELLESPAYAAWWTTKLCDFTGNNEQQLNNVSPMRGFAGKEWYNWIYQRVANNTPYDQLVEGIATAKSREEGESYRQFCEEMSALYSDGSEVDFADRSGMTHYWARRDFRELEARAIGFAYSFMGIRIQCAQCHKHPFDQWSKDDFHQFKNLFARVSSANRPRDREGQQEYNKMVKQLGIEGKRNNELRRMLPAMLKEGKTIPFPEVIVTTRPQRRRNNAEDYPVFEHAKLLGGDQVEITGEDPRVALMQWLRQADNRFFAPAFVNRVWASYFNVGIVNPPDDLSLANPPSNKPLLDYLAQGFIESGFDMKWLHREIANSRTYQLTWRPNETNLKDEHNFSRSVPRRLPAEVAYDAIQLATSSDGKAEEMQTELQGRAIAIPSVNYRGNRNANGAAYALNVFGRSRRESNCDCDRSMESSLLQTVFLQNDQETLRLLSVRPDGWLEQVAEDLYPQRAKQDKRGNPKQLQAARQQTLQLQRQLNKLRNKPEKDAAQITRLQRRLKAARQRLESLAPAAAAEKVDVDEAKLHQLVREAYLRTLSRYPAEDELARAARYVQQADDTLNGVRDVLWALVNTKEFIVNH